MIIQVLQPSPIFFRFRLMLRTVELLEAQAQCAHSMTSPRLFAGLDTDFRPPEADQALLVKVTGLERFRIMPWKLKHPGRMRSLPGFGKVFASVLVPSTSANRPTSRFRL